MDSNQKCPLDPKIKNQISKIQIKIRKCPESIFEPIRFPIDVISNPHSNITNEYETLVVSHLDSAR
jgi:hypothetical protein